MKGTDYFIKANKIASDAREKLFDIIKEMVFGNDINTTKIIDLDNGIELGGDDSICKYYTLYSKIKYECESICLYNMLDGCWEDISILSFNELYELIAVLTQFNFVD